MGNRVDIKGKRFGFWVAIEQGENNKYGQTQWLCECECGNKKLVTTNSLRTGNSTSCGCNHCPDLIGEKFGKLTVIKLADEEINNIKGRRHWVCECECKRKVIASTYQLRNGRIASCGTIKCNKKNKTNKKINKIDNDNIKEIDITMIPEFNKLIDEELKKDLSDVHNNVKKLIQNQMNIIQYLKVLNKK